MEKLICFNLNDDIVYCPIHLNNSVFANNDGGDKNCSVCQEMLCDIIGTLVPEVNYVLDFTQCLGSIESTPDILKCLKNVNVLILADEKFKEALGNLERELEITVEKWGTNENRFWIVKFKKNLVLNKYIDALENEEGEYSPSDYFSKLVLTKFFYEDIKENPKYDFSQRNKKYLGSSNVYVNKYINVKSLFLDYDYMMLMISELVKLINKHFNRYEGQISLLGVSNNGIILANMLSYQLRTSAYSLKRLGPVYCLEDNANRLGDFQDKKYILVSDVICMGGEYRMAKGIVDILGSKLLGGISVVKIRDAYRGENEEEIYAVIDDINQFTIEGRKIDYQVYIDDQVNEEE